MTSFHGLLHITIRATALTVLAGLASCNCGSKSTAVAPAPQTYGYTPPDYSETTTTQRTTTGVATEGCVYYPTGRRETSVVQLCVTGPREVALGKSYTYNVQVTNLTQQNLSEVMIRNMHDSGMDSGF